MFIFNGNVCYLMDLYWTLGTIVTSPQSEEYVYFRTGMIEPFASVLHNNLTFKGLSYNVNDRIVLREASSWTLVTALAHAAG